MEEEEFTPSSECLNGTEFQHPFTQNQDDLLAERNNMSNEYCQPTRYAEKNYFMNNNGQYLQQQQNLAGKNQLLSQQITHPPSASNPIDYYKKLQEIMQKGEGQQTQQQDKRSNGNLIKQRQETHQMRYPCQQIESANGGENNRGKQEEQLQFYNQKNCGNLGSNNLFNPSYTDPSQSNNNTDNLDGCFNVQKGQKPQQGEDDKDNENNNNNDKNNNSNKNLQIISTLPITEHEDIGQLQFEEFEFSERVEEPNSEENKHSLGMKYILPYQIPQVKAFLLNGEIIVSFELFEKSSKADFNKVSTWNMFRPIAAISNMKNIIEVSMHSSQHTISDFQPIISRLLSLGDQEAYASARMLTQHQLSLQKEESIKSQVFEIYGEKHLQHLQWQLEENFLKSKQLGYALMDKLPEESLFLYSIRRTDPATLDSIFCGLGYSKALIRLLAGSDSNYQQYCMRQGLPEFFDNKSLLQILMMNLLASNKAQMTITTLDDITLPIEMRVHYQKLAQTEILPGVFKEDYMKIYQIIVSQKSLHQIHCLRGFQHGSSNELVTTRNSPCELTYSMKSHSFIQRYYPDDRNGSQKIAGQVDVDPEEFSKDFQRIFGNQNEGQNFLNNVYNTTIAPARKETNKIISASCIESEDNNNNKRNNNNSDNNSDKNNKNTTTKTKKRTSNTNKKNITKSNPPRQMRFDGIVSSESSSNESMINAFMRNIPSNHNNPVDLSNLPYIDMPRTASNNSEDRVEEEKIEFQSQLRPNTFAAARIETPQMQANAAISPSVTAGAALAFPPEDSLCISDSQKSYQNLQSFDNSSVFCQQVGRQTASPQNSRECSDILLLH